MKHSFKINVAGFGCPPDNEVMDLGAGYVSYNFELKETAVVLKGTDGIGVMYLIVRGDKREDVAKVVEDAVAIWGEDSAFAAAFSWACKHPDLDLSRTTFGPFGCRLKIRRFGE